MTPRPPPRRTPTPARPPPAASRPRAGAPGGSPTLDEAELTAQHSPLMSPLVWDLAHIGQQEDLLLLRGGDPARLGLLSAQVERLYDAFEHPRATPGHAAAAHPGRGPLLPGRRARPGPRRPRDGATTTRCSPTSWSSSTSSSTSRPCSPPTSCGWGSRCSARAPRCRRAGCCRPTTPSWCPPARSCSASTPSTSPARSTTSGPPHVVDLPAFRIGRVPVTNAAVAAVRRRRRLRRAPLVVRARLAAPGRGRAGAAAVLVGRRLAAPVRRRRGGAARRARAARVLLRGRGLRRLGRRPAAHRAGVGEGLRLGPERLGPAPPLALGRQRLDAGAGQPRRRGAATGPGRAPTRPGRRPTASSS